ncbi:MAG TPA: nucleotide sugar dehydrogenase [Chloroflexota bacterium]|nr:nucleotide sugar dehydrogenase [Chloroflexota bacterium]
MRVCVVGLGKMGLPLAVHYAGRGLSVVGCDVNPAIVDAVNGGNTGMTEEPELADRLARVRRDDLLRATIDTAEAVRKSDVVLVIVQVSLDDEHRVDFSAIDAATRDIGRGLHAGTLVIYETTLPVGSTRQRFGPALESQSGLRAGEDFLLAFSPERVMSGSVFANLECYPKIVGGINSGSGEAAARFYTSALTPDVKLLASAEAAELSKLVETTYRDVNIALANEFAQFADFHGIDVMEVISAANSQPYSHVHRPGLGVGGHCIPVYPHFLLAGQSTLGLPRIARGVNDGMVAYGVELLKEALGGLSGKQVVILGLAYRENVKETSFSCAIPLIHQLKGSGASVFLNDPMFSPEEISRYGAHPVDLDAGLEVDALVLQAYHRQYHNLDYGLFRGLRVVLDGRNVLDPALIQRLGVHYLGIGKRGVASLAGTGHVASRGIN